MPSEHSATPSAQLPDQQQGQVKLCSRCHSPLSSDLDNAFLFDPVDPNDHLMICRICRDVPLSRANQDRLLRIIVEDGPIRRAPTHGINEADRLPLNGPIHRSLVEDHEMETSASIYPLSSPSFHDQLPVPSPPAEPLPSPRPAPSSKPARLTINCTTPPPTTNVFPRPSSPVLSPRIASSSKTSAYPYSCANPDPFVDITRIRMRSQGHHCLYPGATFQGTQKSGRSSYDVTVTIVDVDFSSSFLCGYLCIRGLTEDWPELTTYFDAEIIGSRYGFLTRNWGANEQEDMVHWARFPAFRHVKNKLKLPHLTMDGDCGAVFMRWKERFLVPDHRVQDIHGASFAGFYYVCVDFNSHPPPPSTARSSAVATRPPAVQPSPLREELNPDALQLATSPKPEPQPRARDLSTEGEGPTRRSSSVGARAGPPVATMSGFYFHQNSEPYQQLSLKHVPESVSTSFEMR
ncbi:hypothetical protein DENSPDRAFT_835145 [Dentipellis sp. KUC8613]|nr:hypothetical protein DENSPDRAFT_835145 [Dentipellis sp. KUC8613]